MTGKGETSKRRLSAEEESHPSGTGPLGTQPKLKITVSISLS